MEKKYGCVYADPPWNLSGGKNGKGGWSSTVSPGSHYDLMSTEWVKSLPVRNIVLEDSCLFLWVVNGLLQDGLDVMKNWGFRYVNNLVWRKTTGYGIGQYIRGEHEICLFGVRGRPGYKRDAVGKRVQVRSVVDAPRGRHSEKPEEMRRRVELIAPGPYIELFRRGISPQGWDCWGNEASDSMDIFNLGTVEKCKRLVGSTMVEFPRPCAGCSLKYGHEHIGHNATDTEWYCSPECYDKVYPNGRSEVIYVTIP